MLSKGTCQFLEQAGIAKQTFIKICMMKNEMAHIHILPHPLLREHIAHYTFHLPSAVETYTSMLIPDASGSIACFFHTDGPQFYIWGPSSRIFHAPVHPQSPMCLFVDFLPAGAHSLLKSLPMSEVGDKSFPLAVVDKDLGVDTERTIAQFISLERVSSGHSRHIGKVIEESVSDLPAFIDALDSIFLRCLFNKTSILNSFIRLVLESSGSLRVAELAKFLRYSPRHLNRLCMQQVGLSAKCFSRVVRVNIACERLKRSEVSLAELTYDLGYYDQSHFINDFKNICEIPPSHYLQNPSAFYSESYKLSAAN